MDHELVVGCLCGAAPVTHSRYLGNRTRLPIRPPATPDRVDRMFAEFRRAIIRTPWRERHRQAYISPDIWSLIDNRIAARRRQEQRRSWSLNRTMKAGIQEDRRIRAAEAGSAVESLFQSYPPLIREAWICMRGWYKTGSSPRYPLSSHSMVCIKNHLFIVVIGATLNKELELIFLSDRTYVYS